MPAVALSRVGARVVESGPDGGNLAAGAWQRLEALPDPRSPQGRIYPLACLIAVAVCAFTAAGNDRFTAVGQWIKRASQADLARLRAPWDPIAGRYRAPDEKTIRVVLDRLDPRALTRALLGPRRAAAGAAAGRPRPACAATGPGAPPGRRKRWPASRLRAVAVDGKTSRGARRADGTRVHLLGAAEHGGHLLDHLEVDVKHNETSHFTELLGPLDLDGAVVTFDALHTVRANLDWLAAEKKAQYIAVVKQNQPLLHARVRALPWRQVPAGSITRETGHGRTETRTLKAAHVSRLDFPHARQAIKITRWRQGHRHRQDLPRDRLRRHQPDQRARHHAGPGPPGPRALVHRGAPPYPGHRRSGEDTATSRTGSGPANLATIRAAVIAAIKDAGYLHIPEGRRDHTTPAETLHLHGLD